MRAVAAARQWSVTRGPASRVRGAAVSLLLLAATLIGCAAVGLSVTQANDCRLVAEQHARLQSALDGMHAVLGTMRRFDDAELRLLAEQSGLDDLRFERDLAPQRGRELQSLQDGQGRIIGWLSWAPDRGLIRAMQWLWALSGGLALALMICAGLALRRFGPHSEPEQSERRLLLRELTSALAAGAIDVHYQPIVAAAGGVIIGVEALLRWRHPRRGDIAPSVFVPIAEQHGLMNELGAFVLRRALADVARWPSLFVAVNLSPVQMRDPHLVDLVAGVIAKAAIAPARVVLEMTEGILVDDPEDIQLRLEALRALGVKLALDDFGTGYSSLSYLQKFPFQRLKIDRAFVAALGVVGNAGAIIHSIVMLGRALGMTVLAEGVETDQQRVLLRLAGCDEMQGFLFARPRPAAGIDALVLRGAAGRAPPAVAAAS